METIRNNYDAIVGELAKRAKLIMAENKELTRAECVRQAIDDGFYYKDDQAYALAWAYENGTINWGAEVDWFAVDNMLVEDILEELGGENE